MAPCTGLAQLGALTVLLLPAVAWAQVTCPQPGYTTINLDAFGDPEIQVEAKTSWELLYTQAGGSMGLPVGCNPYNFATVITAACKRQVNSVTTDWILNYNTILHECGLQVPTQVRTFDPDGARGPKPTVLQQHSIGQIKDYQNLVACDKVGAAQPGQGAPGGWSYVSTNDEGAVNAAHAAFQQIVQWKGTGNVNPACNFALPPAIAVTSACTQVANGDNYRVVFTATMPAPCGESSSIQAAVNQAAGAVGIVTTDKHFTISPWGANGLDDTRTFPSGAQCGGKGGECRAPASQLYCVDAPYPMTRCSPGVCVRNSAYVWKCT